MDFRQGSVHVVPRFFQDFESLHQPHFRLTLFLKGAQVVSYCNQ